MTSTVDPSSRSLAIRHEVVICTMDRPEELRGCLDALKRQTDPPDRIIVVDGSAHSTAPNTAGNAIPVLWIRSSPGLTRQRNIALDLVSDDTAVIHFIDDDAVPESEYLRTKNRVFALSDRVVGVGGLITNLPRHRPWLIERLFLLNSRRQGALLSSGRATLVFDATKDLEVDWLSGCCMSYRRSAIEGLRFDERRTASGRGEDLDFSVRARSRGVLVCTPAARIAHEQSPLARESSVAIARQDVHGSWLMAKDRIGGVRRVSVLFSIIGLVVVTVIRSIRRRSLTPMTTAHGSVLGLIDVVLRRVPGSTV